MVRSSVSLPRSDRLTDEPCEYYFSVHLMSSHCTLYDLVYRVGVPELAAAVSNAGGLGILTALTQPNPNALREAIRKTRKLTDKNFGVNITLLPSINPPDYEGYARAAVEEGVRVFETAGNNRQLFCTSCPILFGPDIDGWNSWTPHQVLQAERMHRDPQV
jgi:NAD(P)H-dependent flavin oxidoreductase YrpB (nitropropane dioxygenase family)